MTRRLLLAAALSSATVVAGCSSQHHDPAPTVSGAANTTPASTVPSTAQPRRTQVIQSKAPRPTSGASQPSVRPDPAITTPAIPSPPTATRTPLDAARAWAIAANSSSYLDPSPGTWTRRAAPFVTGTEAAAEQQQRNGGGGTTWTRIQTGKCVTTLQQLAATIPSDAPSGPTRRVVYLTAVTTLRCATGQVHLSQFAAQLLLVRIHDRWLVAEAHH